MTSKLHNQNGQTLLECLVALLITFPIFSAALFTLHLCNLEMDRAALHYQTSKTILRIDQLFKQVALDTASHSIKILPRLHRNGAIAYTDNSANAVMTTGPGIGPSPTSDALSTIVLATRQTLKVIDVSGVFPSVTVEGCSRYNIPISDFKFRTILALAVDMQAEMLVENVQETSANCFKLRLTSSRSMHAIQDLIPGPALQVVVPVSDSYTIYVDNQNQVRFLRHAGEFNIENQPVTGNIGEVRITDIFSADVPYPTLGIALRTLSDTKIWQRTYLAHRKTPLGMNFLLHTR